MLGHLDDNAEQPQRKTATGQIKEITLKRYETKKFANVVASVTICVLFFVSGILLGYAAIHESKTGYIPKLFQSKTELEIVTGIYTLVSSLLLLSLIYTGYQFSRDGEGQLDTLISNCLSLLTIFVIGISLLGSYIISESDDIYTKKKIRYHIYIFGTVQCVWVIIMFVRSITRLCAIEHMPIDYQVWSDVNYEGPTQPFFIKHFIKASAGRWIYAIIISVFSIPAIIMGAWVTTKDFHRRGLVFDDVFLPYIIVMTIVSTILFSTYIYWNVNTKNFNFDKIFRVHFNHYYITNVFPVILIMLSLLSYRHNYMDVVAFHGISQDDFQHIKKTHISNLINLYLCFAPFMASGIGRAMCLFSNFIPLLHPENHHDFEKDKMYLID
ncbi:MAG: hypothetical protein EOP34_03000 [Rickettsiales bacterium]|nr:MAG: hypothetical protein EOP34_03000 [Rickettsiales bacterium]